MNFVRSPIYITNRIGLTETFFLPSENKEKKRGEHARAGGKLQHLHSFSLLKRELFFDHQRKINESLKVNESFSLLKGSQESNKKAISFNIPKPLTRGKHHLTKIFLNIQAAYTNELDLVNNFTIFSERTT